MTEDEKGFVIKDRRVFTEEGSEENASEEASEAATGADDTSREEDAAADASAEESSPLPKIDFATFVFSLNSSVLVHLGILEDPSTGKREKNLPIAKQTIDLLGLLDEKTRGNLTTDEENLLKNILHDLRLMFVKEQG